MHSPTLSSILLLLLATTANAGIVRVPASDFSVDGETANYATFVPHNGYWVKVSPTGSALFHATVHLPDGVTITRFTSRFYDDDGTGDVEVNLRRKSWTTGTGPSNVVGATGSSGASALDQSDDANVITNGVVDNDGYFYFVQAGFNSPTSGQRRFYGVEIEYDEPVSAADPIGVGRSEVGVSGFPNPFRHDTTVRFSIATASDVRVEIYDARGRRVRTIVEGALGGGSHQIVWDGRDDAGRSTASGVYFAQVRSATEVLGGKLVHLK
jgi:hypothetical protein